MLRLFSFVVYVRLLLLLARKLSKTGQKRSPQSNRLLNQQRSLLL